MNTIRFVFAPVGTSPSSKNTLRHLSTDAEEIRGGATEVDRDVIRDQAKFFRTNDIFSPRDDEIAAWQQRQDGGPAPSPGRHLRIIGRGTKTGRGYDIVGVTYWVAPL